jgi:hypothetical protein
VLGLVKSVSDIEYVCHAGLQHLRRIMPDSRNARQGGRYRSARIKLPRDLSG